MTSRALSFVLLALLASLALAPPAAPSSPAPQQLPFVNDWSDTAAISADDDWSGVAGVVGHRGDDLTASEGVDPQTILADGAATPVDVIANRTTAAAVFAGGVAEFELADPVVALRGSITADAPHLVVALDTSGYGGIRVSYRLRDLDASDADAAQAFALQYRVGGGGYANVPDAFVADATDGHHASRVTPVEAALPADAADLAHLELRILTANAGGRDEWVGVDDLAVTGTPIVPPDATAPELTLALAKRGRVATALACGIRAQATVDEPAELRTTLRLSRRLASRLDLPRTVGAASIAADAGTTTLVTRFRSIARRKLARRTAFRVKVVVRAVDAAGNRSRRAAWILLRR